MAANVTVRAQISLIGGTRGLPRYDERCQPLPAGPSLDGQWLLLYNLRDGSPAWKVMEDLFAAKRYLVNQGIVASEREIEVIHTPVDRSHGWKGGLPAVTTA